MEIMEAKKNAHAVMKAHVHVKSKTTKVDAAAAIAVAKLVSLFSV